MLYEALSGYQLNKHYENTFVLNEERFTALTSHLQVPRDIEICENTFPIISEEYQGYVEYDKFKKKVFGMTIKVNGHLFL